MAFVQILFGTAVLSSLTFIATLDAVVVILRYVVSGCVCRIILMYELQGMRLVENAEGSEAVPLQQGPADHTTLLGPNKMDGRGTT